MISFVNVSSTLILSHLTQVSGLKFMMKEFTIVKNGVSPYTGEWIEIYSTLNNRAECLVSPYTGEWIEILNKLLE